MPRPTKDDREWFNHAARQARARAPTPEGEGYRSGYFDAIPEEPDEEPEPAITEGEEQPIRVMVPYPALAREHACEEIIQAIPEPALPIKAVRLDPPPPSPQERTAPRQPFGSPFKPPPQPTLAPNVFAFIWQNMPKHIRFFGLLGLGYIIFYFLFLL